MGQLDFSIGDAHVAAIIIGLLQPLLLWPLSRLPSLAGRHPMQFLLSTVAIVVLWLLVVLLLPAARPANAGDIAAGLMTLAGAMLVWLEIWGLMSRGYTLGILLTLLGGGRPMRANEIASAYRGGDGLGWIMRHRLSGLSAAGALVQSGDTLVLTARGRAIAHLHRACTAILGLGRTG